MQLTYCGTHEHAIAHDRIASSTSLMITVLYFYFKLNIISTATFSDLFKSISICN